MTKWYSKKLFYCHWFSFWRHNVYQPSLDKYNSCLCRTVTGLFSTLEIARTCFCCVCLISLTAMSKHGSWGGGRAYIYIYMCVLMLVMKYGPIQKDKTVLHGMPILCWPSCWFEQCSSWNGMLTDFQRWGKRLATAHAPFSKPNSHHGFVPYV